MEGIQNFFKMIAALFASIFSGIGNFFSGLSGKEPAANTAGASGVRPEKATSASVESAPLSEEEKQAVAAKRAKISVEMKNEIGSALTGAYQHTGEKAAKSDAMAAKSDQLFKESSAAQSADNKMFADVASKGGYMTPEWSKAALPMYLAHNPTHHESVMAEGALKEHQSAVNRQFKGHGMDNVGLSRLAVDPQNDVAAKDVFSQDKHGLRIAPPPNSRIDIQSVGHGNVSVTVRPISDDPRNPDNFAPVTIPSISKKIFSEQFVSAQAPEHGEVQIYAQKNLLPPGTSLAMAGGSGVEIKSKGIDVAIMKDGKAVTQEAVATLSNYKPAPAKHTTDFRGATVPVPANAIGHGSDPEDNYKLANLRRQNGYYRGGNYGGNWSPGRVGRHTETRTGHGLGYHRSNALGTGVNTPD